MSSTKASDYLEWTRKNFPNLTEEERGILYNTLSGWRASPVDLQEIEAIRASSQGATREALMGKIIRIMKLRLIEQS